MPNTDTERLPPRGDDRLTAASIAILAFIIADLAHEGLGHGLGFYLAGGHSSMLTTTRLIEWVQLGDPGWRIFDLGGPAGNLVVGGLAWAGQRLVQKFVRGVPEKLHLFLWLVMAFSLFWAVGYLISCGVTGKGDWMALVQGTPFAWPGRVLFLVGGFALYRACIRLVAGDLRWIVPAQDPDAPSRVGRLIWIAYLFGGAIACAGAILDPRGTAQILRSGAASSFGAAVGLLFVPGVFRTLPAKYAPAPGGFRRGLPWLLAAAAGALYYIAILGPGILLWFES